MKRFLLDRRMYVEYMVAAVLFAADILLTLFMPYLTEHKRYYDSDAYIVTLVIAFLLYTVSVHATRKKSASDIAVVLFAFFAVWEIAYKTGENSVMLPNTCPLPNHRHSQKDRGTGSLTRQPQLCQVHTRPCAHF